MQQVKRDGEHGTQLTKCTENESINYVESVEPLCDKMDSNISIKVMPCQDTEIIPGTYVEAVLHSEDYKNLVIDKGPMDTNCIQESMLEGRRFETLCVSTEMSIDECIDFLESVKSLSDQMDSQNCTEEVHSLKAVEGTHENVEHCEDDNNLVIEKGPMDTNRIQESMFEGRRIETCYGSTVDESVDSSKSVVTSGTMDVEICTQQTCLAVTPKCKDTYDNVQYRENDDIEHYIHVEGAKESTYVRKSVESLVTPGTMDVELRTQQTCPAVTPACTNYIQYWTSPDDDDIENHNLVIEKGGTEEGLEEHKLEGRRIVDFNFVLNELHRTFDDHAPVMNCQFKYWKLVASRRVGLMTQFYYKCQFCNHTAKFWSEPKKPDVLDINTAAVAGTITTGIGYAQLKEQHAAMNIPCMSEVTYIKYREQLVEEFAKTAMENMKMAGEVEKQLALERNETKHGIPYITVIADGSWMKRSYGKAYDSLSGVGVIIGYRTQKVLFVGIRNKCCAICDMAERQGRESKTHTCYKNFDRNASSTSMESDAIVEGFKSSLEMHGLIYETVIADGDSNVYQAIIDNKPYHEQMVTVKKIECTNHLLRNLCKKLRAVAETTQSKRMRGFIDMRNDRVEKRAF